jgi:DUF4097 and DUF4098 domain-containing protein YvlB
MKKSDLKILALVLCLCLLLLVNGCDIRIGNWGQAKHERTVQRQTPLAAGSTLVVETSSGSVTVIGAEVTDCNVVARISGRAPAEEEAQQLAEQVKIELEAVGNTLTVKAEKPSTKRNRSISISYEITVPRQTNIECTSSYGSVRLTDIDGDVNGKTKSGPITAQNIEGSANLDTSYGSINCKDISGDNIRLKSSSGSITAESIKGPADISTSYGPINCKDMSGGDIIKLKTSSGQIKLSNASFGDCDAHTSYGSIVSDRLKGDSVKLHSSSGSIKVTDAAANTAELTTSYGRITCRQITTGQLTAKSGSGDIDIACSDSAPAQIIANLVTSYGSIDFTAPPNFSGEVDLSTSHGSIKTGLPITISGEISKKKLKGTIGHGKGKLNFQTSSGSIEIKW